VTWQPFTLVGDSDNTGPFLFVCEHGSNHVPPGYVATAADLLMLDDHWGWDIGTHEVVEGLVAELGGQGVVCGTTRLIVDANRPPSADSFIVTEIDGHVVDFNRHLDEVEVAERTEKYFGSYHGAIEAAGRARREHAKPFHLVSIHSFTPELNGSLRDMEVGILFDDFDDDVAKVEAALREEHFVTALNQPYSGRGPGALIYSANRHGHSLGIKYIELEIRNDLISHADDARAVATRLARGLLAFAPEVHEPT